MTSVFSHIVLKRLSQEYENVATEALAYIVNSSKGAHAGLMKVLRGIVSDSLPVLHFETQYSFDNPEADGSARPDMWGSDGRTLRVFIENKFGAGLTENQPVNYLKELARCSTGPAVLLMVVPETRLETVSRECTHRLRQVPVVIAPPDRSSGEHRFEPIDFGATDGTRPRFAIISWKKLLDAIDTELTDEPRTRNDLAQLKALCDAAVAEYVPFSTTELTNQRTPAVILQLNRIVEATLQQGASDEFLKILSYGGSSDRPGRYIRLKDCGIEPMLGIDFSLWRSADPTPLWLWFSKDGGRAREVRPLLKPWLVEKNIAFFDQSDGSFSVGIYVVSGEDKKHVVAAIMGQLRAVAAQLSPLLAKPGGTP